MPKQKQKRILGTKVLTTNKVLNLNHKLTVKVQRNSAIFNLFINKWTLLLPTKCIIFQVKRYINKDLMGTISFYMDQSTNRIWIFNFKIGNKIISIQECIKINKIIFLLFKIKCTIRNNLWTKMIVLITNNN